MNKYITHFYLQDSWNIVRFLFQNLKLLDSADFTNAAFI